jgi:hypothetical protein
MNAPSPELMKQQMGAGGGGGNAPPAGGPMTTPQPKEGLSQAAMVNIAMVLHLLEQSLPAFGSPTDKGKAILSALKGLGSAFGKERPKSDALIPAELQQLMATQPGGKPPGAPQGMPPGAGAPQPQPQGAMQ